MTAVHRTVKWLGLATVVALACGDGRVAQTGSGGGSTAADESTSTTGASATDPTSSATGTTSSGDPSDSSSDASTGSAPDPPPYPTACDAPEALIDVTSSGTPLGPMTIDEAWVELDFCSYGPFIVLAQTPTLDMPEGIQVHVEIRPDRLPHDPFLGEYPAAVWLDGEAVGTIEVLEPFTDPSEVGIPRPDEHLHARIEIHGGGYDLSLEVDLIDCGVANCYCPCR